MRRVAGDRVNSFAVVAYIPGPMGTFVDRLNRELTPGCSPRAHVTVLPPRPLAGTVGEAAEAIRTLARETSPIRVEAVGVDVFTVSSVVYLRIGKGREELHATHDLFNSTDFRVEESFRYHPHITLANDVDPARLAGVAETARRLWDEYRGPRSFLVEEVTLVQATTTSRWIDLASYPLGVVAPVR